MAYVLYMAIFPLYQAQLLTQRRCLVIVEKKPWSNTWTNSDGRFSTWCYNYLSKAEFYVVLDGGTMMMMMVMIMKIKMVLSIAMCQALW